jgi:hypothetical protein
MIEALETKHFANAAGEYLGGFGGIRRTTETPNPREVVVKDPDTGEESRSIEYDPPTVTVTEEWPDLPAGAVEVPLPPASRLDRFVGGAWVSPAASVVAADNLKIARTRIAGNPEMMAILEAVASRLSVPTGDLLADVAGRLAQRG